MDKAVDLANQTARLLAEHYGLPVYLYDYAASNEERRSINRIREGEFELFHKKIKLPEWKPDFGPSRVHSTGGVTAVGARYPLVAFNALIRSENETTALQIAEAINKDWFDRQVVKTSVTHSEELGGFRIAVSILDYKSVRLYQAVRALMEEAEKRGAIYGGTELVGLVTGEALFDCLEHILILKDFDPLQILDFHVPQRRKI
jgi:glutamate formiminotransferase